MSDDNHYMNLALQQAEIAAENGEVPVGAVVLLEDGQVVASHNAPIMLHDPTAHAELRAIRNACELTGNYRLNGATLYVTLEPCGMCAGAIVHARIKRVVYGARDEKTGAVASLYQLLSDSRLNHQPEVVAGMMADQCSDLLKRFFRARRASKR